MHDDTIGDYLHQLADRVPAPGGGAATAVHAAQAAALLAMVGRYSTGPKYAEHADTITAVITEADALRARALELAAEDVAAFNAVAAAYGLPNQTTEDRAARSAAIAQTAAAAAAPPAATIEVARRLVELAEVLLPVGNRNVVTDVAAAAEAARAAAATARVNVEVNLRGADEAARGTVSAPLATVDDILTRADAVTAAVRQQLR